MKIKLLNIENTIIQDEIDIINHSFLDTWEFAKADHDFFFDGHSVDADTSERSGRRKIIKAYYKQMATFLQRELPWGLMHHMRPTKYVHSMIKHGKCESEIREHLKSEYFVTDEKIDLLLQTAHHQLKVIPDLYHIENEVSIYIGIPFCPTICAYCTFSVHATAPNKKWIEPFIKTLLAEIKITGEHLQKEGITVTSVYIGGGTPTALEAEDLHKILTAIHTYIAKPEDLREMTVEAGRPDTITKEKLQLLKEFKVDRISINPQSFIDETLKKIGRHHTTNEVKTGFQLAKEVGIENINMDVIVGLPNEGPAELEYTLAQIKKMQPESLTVHMLAFKRKSELEKNRALYTVATHDALTKMAELTYAFADENNYLAYYLYRQKNIAGNMENIGYAKAGFECIYNILMMEEAQNILGLGVGASSKFLVGATVRNPIDLRAYIDNVDTYMERKLELLREARSTGAQSFKAHG